MVCSRVVGTPWFSSYTSNKNKMVYRKETVMSVWGRSSPVLNGSHTALHQKREVSDSIAFVSYIELRIRPIVFELCVTNKKERKKERRRRKQTFLQTIFATLRNASGSLEEFPTLE